MLIACFTKLNFRVNKIENFFNCSKKYLTSYLIKEGVKEDDMNKGMNKSVDELYGKPFNKKKAIVQNIFISKLKSKVEIDKLSRTGNLRGLI